MNDDSLSITFSRAPLREILGELSEDRLAEVAHFHADSGYGSSPADIRAGADDWLYTPRHAGALFNVVSGFDLPVMELFVAAMEDRPATASLADAEYLFGQLPARIDAESDERWHVTLPAELQNAWSSYYGRDTFVETARRFDTMLPYADASVRLYGAMPWKDFLAMVRRRSGFFCRNRIENEWLQYRLASLSQWASVCDDILFHETLFDPENDGDGSEFGDNPPAPAAVRELLAAVEDKPRYGPPNEEFLAWADPNHMEDTEALDNFREWAYEAFGEFLGEALVRQTVNLIRTGARLPDVLRQFEEDDIDVDADGNGADVRAMLQDVCDNTRLWLNKGHTARESLSRIAGKLGSGFTLGMRTRR